ncbi:MAG TPA: ATP synthase F0 subunit C [Anaerohalosphaeraceae bacterium]|jgi:F-type H+-transporting ATPase subunit c|nr:ATP synthase F0 subunit C [Anaerohalosphaeraceae bacterium]
MFELMTLAPMLLAELNIDDKGLGMLGGVLGCGLIVMGSAKGIGQLAGSAVEAIARQPEAANRIFTTMIIAAALIEGVTLFAMIICLLAVL